MRQKFNDEAMLATVALAKRASLAIMEIYDRTEEGIGLGLSYKTDQSPLTCADLLAHQIIVDGLSILSPGVPVVSEEDAERCALDAIQDFWLVDPLDGTKEFLARNGEFTVNIAFISGGQPVFGVVVAPALGQAYWGGEKIGAFREIGGCIEPIKAAQNVEERSLRIVASKSHLNAETMAFIAKFGLYKLVQAGSSLKFCRVAEGAADIYPRLGLTCEWDTAAAQAVLEGAGGRVCALDGQPVRYGKAEVLNPFFIAAAPHVVL